MRYSLLEKEIPELEELMFEDDLYDIPNEEEARERYEAMLSPFLTI